MSGVVKARAMRKMTEAKLRETLGGLISPFIQPVRELVVKEYQKFKRVQLRRVGMVRRHAKHLVITSSIMVVLVAFPISLAYAGAWSGNNFSSDLMMFFSIHAIFFGLAGMIAVGYVYVSRLGFWIRRSMIQYWRVRTLPFPNDDGSSTDFASRVDEIPREDWEQAKEQILTHLNYSIILNVIGFWGIIIVLEVVPWVDDRLVLNVVKFVTQAFAVLLGGLPALAGIVIVNPQIPVVGSMNGTDLLLLIAGSFIPALVLAISVRSLAYVLEVKLHTWWSDGHPLIKILIIGYLLWLLTITIDVTTAHTFVI